MKLWENDSGKLISNCSELLSCEVCPCFQGAVVARCSIDHKGNPNCGCDSLEAYGWLMVLPLHHCPDGVRILYGGEWQEPDKVLTDGWGNRFRLRVVEEYDTTGKAQDALTPPGWAGKTQEAVEAEKRAWGERAVEVCACTCCFLPFMGRVEFEFGMQEYGDYVSPEEINRHYRGDTVVEITPAREQFSFSVDDFDFSANYIAPGSTGFECHDNGPNPEKAITLVFKVSEDCSEVTLDEIYSHMSHSSGNICSYDSYFLYLIEPAGGDSCRYAIPLTPPYMEGRWEFACRKNSYGESGEFRGFTTLDGWVQVSRVADAARLIAPAYLDTYNLLSGNLKK